MRPHLSKLASLDEGLCVYFEAVHTDINANFKHLPGFADIRVFDFSRSGSHGVGRFLPFDETIELAKRFDLPLELWADLEKASKRHYATAPAMLEGFVVREAGAGGRIAKARVEQLEAAAAVTAAAVQADPKPKMRSKTKAEAKARCLWGVAGALPERRCTARLASTPLRLSV
eukprot:g21687.t1